jgi:hypothetical protein
LDLEKCYGEGEEGRSVYDARVEGDVGEGIRLAILRGGKEGWFGLVHVCG